MIEYWIQWIQIKSGYRTHDRILAWSNIGYSGYRSNQVTVRMIEYWIQWIQIKSGYRTHDRILDTVDTDQIRLPYAWSNIGYSGYRSNQVTVRMIEYWIQWIQIKSGYRTHDRILDTVDTDQIRLPYAWSNIGYRGYRSNQVTVRMIEYWIQWIQIKSGYRTHDRILYTVDTDQIRLPYAWWNIGYSGYRSNQVTVRMIEYWIQWIQIKSGYRTHDRILDTVDTDQIRLPYAWSNIVYSGYRSNQVTVRMIEYWIQWIQIKSGYRTHDRILDTVDTDQIRLPYAWSNIGYSGYRSNQVTVRMIEYWIQWIQIKSGYRTHDRILYTVDTDQIRSPYAWSNIGYSGYRSNQVTVRMIEYWIQWIQIKSGYRTHDRILDTVDTDQIRLPYAWSNIGYSGYRSNQATVRMSGYIEYWIKSGYRTHDRILDTVDTDQIRLPYAWSNIGYSGYRSNQVTVRMIEYWIQWIQIKSGYRTHDRILDTVDTDQIRLPYAWSNIGYSGYKSNQGSNIGYSGYRSNQVTVRMIEYWIQWIQIKSGYRTHDRILYTVDTDQIRLPYAWSNIGYSGYRSNQVTVRMIEYWIQWIQIKSGYRTHDRILDTVDTVDTDQIRLPYAWSNIGYSGYRSNQVTVRMIEYWIQWIQIKSGYRTHDRILDTVDTDQIRLPYAWSNIVYSGYRSNQVTVRMIEYWIQWIQIKSGYRTHDRILDTVDTDQIRLPYAWSNIGYSGYKSNQVTVRMIEYWIQWIQIKSGYRTHDRILDTVDTDQIRLPYAWSNIGYSGYRSNQVTVRMIEYWIQWIQIKSGYRTHDRILDTVDTDQIRLPYAWSNIGYSGYRSNQVTVRMIEYWIQWIQIKSGYRTHDRILDTVDTDQIRLPYAWSNIVYSGYRSNQVTVRMIEYWIQWIQIKSGYRTHDRILDAVDTDQIRLPYAWSNIGYSGYKSNQVTVRMIEYWIQWIQIKSGYRTHDRILDTVDTDQIRLPYAWSNIGYSGYRSNQVTVRMIEYWIQWIQIKSGYRTHDRILDTVDTDQIRLPYAWSNIGYSGYRSNQATVRMIEYWIQWIQIKSGYRTHDRILDTVDTDQIRLPYAWSNIGYSGYRSNQVTVRMIEYWIQWIQIKSGYRTHDRILDTVDTDQIRLPYAWSNIGYSGYRSNQATVRMIEYWIQWIQINTLEYCWIKIEQRLGILVNPHCIACILVW